MKIEKIEMIYSQGTAEHPEDGLIINLPFLGVVDCFSQAYSYDEPPRPFARGVVLRQTILETFYTANPTYPLEKVILDANQRIGEIQMSGGISLEQAGQLAGASFVFAKITAEKILIIQGGDCLAVWEYRSGKVGVTKNQAYQSVSEAVKTIAKLMEKHAGNRKEMWVEFRPILAELRERDINKPIKTGYAVLNGQAALNRCWQRIEIPLEGLGHLLLFSDGLLPLEETAKEIEMAERVINLYKKKGLGWILERKREIEKEREETSHTSQEEVSAIALSFLGN